MRSRSSWAPVLIAAASLAIASPAAALGVIGVRGGVSIATADVEADNLFDDSNRTGFAGTAFATLGLGVFTLQPEASYLQKGVEDFHIDYFELAALLKFGIPLIPVIEPHLLAGVGADFEVDSENDSVNTADTDWNAIFGADCFFYLSKLILVADVRYAVGLQDINDANDAFGDIKNRAWLVSGGVAWKF